ncbi:hypothetical protein ADK64_30355 [Streptomyces sp. MMG1121]|nr:hypothetical protein ADK64_30355 [Streptomyces sp. MMG1121]
MRPDGSTRQDDAHAADLLALRVIRGSTRGSIRSTTRCTVMNRATMTREMACTVGKSWVAAASSRSCPSRPRRTRSPRGPCRPTRSRRSALPWSARCPARCAAHAGGSRAARARAARRRAPRRPGRGRRGQPAVGAPDTRRSPPLPSCQNR